MLPPVSLRKPEYPFQKGSADFFDLEGHQFLVIIDRYSGWPVVARMNKGNAAELCSVIRQYFHTYGCPESFTSDGGKQFDSYEFREFLKRFQCDQHITSAYTPHSNLLAETGIMNYTFTSPP